MRCKGMTLFRMPLLVWLYVVMSGLVLVAVSPLTAAQIMLMIDRYLGGHFFDTQAGGSAVLWAHFFWIFGHPEVYVLVLPAFAFANEIIPVFSRKAIFGYPAMVAASVGIGFISLGVWAHHMFTVGMTSSRMHSSCSRRCWWRFRRASRSSTGWRRCGAARSVSRRRCCSAIAFLFQFLIAGLTGIMLSVAPLELAAAQLVFCGRAFPLRAGRRRSCLHLRRRFITGIPKMTGRMLDERLGKWHFWLFADRLSRDASTSCTFPACWACRGQIYTYEADRGWDDAEPDCYRRRDLSRRSRS